MLPGEKTSLEELRQIMTKSRQEPFILHLITLEVSKLINNQKSDKCSLITYYSRWRTHNLRRPLISALEAFFSKKTLVELQAKNESFAKVFFFYHDVTDEESVLMSRKSTKQKTEAGNRLGNEALNKTFPSMKFEYFNERYTIKLQEVVQDLKLRSSHKKHLKKANKKCRQLHPTSNCQLVSSEEWAI